MANLCARRDDVEVLCVGDLFVVLFCLETLDSGGLEAPLLNI